jgi:hypothetical protein
MAQVSEKQVMVVGIDDSNYSSYALEWTLDHLVTTLPNPVFKLILVYAKPSVSSAVGFVGPGIYICYFVIMFDYYFKFDFDFVTICLFM